MDEKKDAAQEENQTAPEIPPPAPPPIDPPQPPPNPSPEKDDGPKKMSKSEKIMVWATCVIAAGTLVSAAAIFEQWREMVGGGKQTDQIIAAANINAIAATKSAKAAQDFATNAGNINAAMGKAVEKLNLQAAATKSVADQALSQAAIATGQLQVMQADERAWLEFRIQKPQAGGDVGPRVSSGQPLDLPVQIMNSGKTVARNVVMDIFVDILDASQEANLDNVADLTNHHHERSTTGTIFPSADYKVQITRYRDKGGVGPITVPEFIALNEGRSYISTYGIITYDDVFNKHRWTKFCQWGWMNASKGGFSAKKCTAFNSVGGD
jgi:hypothetical protein